MAHNTSESNVVKSLAGHLLNFLNDKDNQARMAKHIAEKTMSFRVGKLSTTDAILLCRVHCGMTVKDVRVTCGVANAADGNNPDVGLSKSSTAAGSLTVLGTAYDGTAQALTARTPLSLSLASTDVDEGDYLWLVVTENGTPAETSGEITVEIEYELDD